MPPGLGAGVAAISRANLFSKCARELWQCCECSAGSAGQNETKSPPGPNLHTGSSCLSLSPLTFLPVPNLINLSFASIGKSLYRQTAPENPNKNRTENGPLVSFFQSLAHLPGSVDNMGRYRARRSAMWLIFLAHCETLSDKGFHTASLRRSRRRLRQSQTTPKREIATAPRGPRNDDSGCVAPRDRVLRSAAITCQKSRPHRRSAMGATGGLKISAKYAIFIARGLRLYTKMNSLGCSCLVCI